VTNLSDRGVGMNVVRENIEAIGGSVPLSSTLGQGTRFSIKIPLTLAIAPALIVQVGRHRFALPQVSVVEAVGLSADAAHHLEHVQGAKVLRLRQEVLPVADLCELFGLVDEAKVSDSRLVVVMRVGTLSFGILVSSVADVQEIVVKPLGASLAHLKVFSGHTILGDGSVVLILDPAGLAGSLGLQHTSDYNVTAPWIERRRPRKHTARSVPRRFRAPEGAAALAGVAHRERRQRSADAIRRHADHDASGQPRTGACDLTRRGVDEGDASHSHYFHREDSMGLLVDEIVDVIEEPLDIQIAGTADDVVGMAEIRGDAVDVLDIMHFLRKVRPDAQLRAARRVRILLVDDKLFLPRHACSCADFRRL
jgi:two-component system, chemotaxis family, sensor kinase CheA